MFEVSVIIPCYNCFNYIQKCIDALEHQSYKDFEVILVDDCSQDNTFELLSKYKESSKLNISLIRNKSNQGPGQARNIGMKNCNSEYIAFCDSDDWYCEEYLNSMIKSAKQNNSDIVFCDSYRIYSTGKKRKCNAQRNCSKNISTKEVLINGNESLCSMLIKKELFNDIAIPKLNNGEDIAIIPILISRAKTFSFVQKPMYYYLYREKSLSSDKKKSIVKSLCIAYKFIYKNLQSKFQFECEYLGIKTILYGAVLNAYQSKMSTKEVKEIIKIFEVQHPRWRTNEYLMKLPLFKRVFVKQVGKGNYIFVRLLSFIHKTLLEWKIV